MWELHFCITISGNVLQRLFVLLILLSICSFKYRYLSPPIMHINTKKYIIILVPMDRQKEKLFDVRHQINTLVFHFCPEYVVLQLKKKLFIKSGRFILLGIIHIKHSYLSGHTAKERFKFKTRHIVLLHLGHHRTWGFHLCPKYRAPRYNIE